LFEKDVFITFALEYTIRKFQDNEERIGLNSIHQLLGHADDVSLLDEHINTRKKNTETILDTSKDDGVEVNDKKISICSCLIIRI
jgi:hypothetical protein